MDNEESKIETNNESEMDKLIDIPNENELEKVENEIKKEDNVKKKPLPVMDVSKRDRLGFEKFFQSPIMKELEEATAKNMEMLEEMEQKMKREREEAEYERQTSHIPIEIKGRGKPIEDLMKILEELIIKSKEEQNKDEIELNKPNNKFLRLNSRKLNDNQVDENKHENDELNQLVYLSFNIYSHLKTFNLNYNLNLIIKEIYSNVTLWLSRLFRFYDSQCIFYNNDYECVINMCNLILNIKYDKELNENGYKLLNNKQPVIYMSSSNRYASIETRNKICEYLRIPYESIRVISTYKQIGDWYDKMNTNELIEQINADINDNKTPMLLIANAGSYTSGQCDDIQELERICTHFKIWLHLDGIQLSTLVLYSIPTALQPINSGDSISLDLGTWLGIPTLSYVTLYKNISSSFDIMQQLRPHIDYLDKLIQYWCVLQAFGHDRIIDKIKYSNDLSKHLIETLNKSQPYLKRILFKDDPNSQVDVTSRKYTFSELVSKALSFLAFIDNSSPIVLFKCNKQFIKDKLLQLNSTQFNDNDSFFDEYCNELTTWLCDLLNSEHKKIQLECIELDDEGVCIRYSPLEHIQLLKTQDDDMILFLKSFEEIVVILDASIKCKASFNNRITKYYPNLVPLECDKWAGIGAVTYVPDYFIDKEFDDKAKDEINKLNIELVRVLQSKDGAFSLGFNSNGLYGVKFGMVNDLESLNSLALQVQQQGKQVEESSKFIEIMSDIVKEGIQKANEDLRKENDQRSVLVQIPFVSELVNWWSGSQAKQPLIGRTFDLQSGKILSTENTIKYHMQIQHENSTDASNEAASSRITKSTPHSSASSVVDDNGEK